MYSDKECNKKTQAKGKEGGKKNGRSPCDRLTPDDNRRRQNFTKKELASFRSLFFGLFQITQESTTLKFIQYLEVARKKSN